MPPATAQQSINYCTAFIERLGAEPEQGLIFLQERLHGPVGIVGVEHLRRGIGHGNARATGAGEGLRRGRGEELPRFNTVILNDVLDRETVKIDEFLDFRLGKALPI